MLFGLPVSTTKGPSSPFTCDKNGCQSSDPTTDALFRQLKDFINRAFVKMGQKGYLSTKDGYLGYDVVSALGMLSQARMLSNMPALQVPADVAQNAPGITQSLITYLGLSPASVFRAGITMRPTVASSVTTAPDPHDIVQSPPFVDSSNPPPGQSSSSMVMCPDGSTPTSAGCMGPSGFVPFGPGDSQYINPAPRSPADCPTGTTFVPASVGDPGFPPMCAPVALTFMDKVMGFFTSPVGILAGLAAIVGGVALYKRKH